MTREEGPAWWTMEQILVKTALLIALREIDSKRYMIVGSYQLMLNKNYLEYVN